MTPMETLQELVRSLEGQAEMRKGILIETALQDPSIDWDAIFQSLSLRGRHKTKKRWRRAVIEDQGVHSCSIE